jgi:phosphoesterase RecJ-like protein
MTSAPSTNSTSDPWTTTIDLDQAADFIANKDTLVLLTHVKPDGDALGSTSAIARAVNLARGTSGAVSAAECWYAAPVPEWSSSILSGVKVRVIDPPEPAPSALDPQGIVITDTGSWSQLAPFKAFLEPRLEKTMIIDHHLQGDPEISSRRLLDTTAAAVVQPAAEICTRILDLDSCAKLPIEIATALYVGLATDTGWFKHSNVDGRVMRLAADLLDAGVDHSALLALLYQRDRAPRLKLMARALDSLELIPEKHAAIMSLSLEDYKATKAAPGDSGGFVDIPQTVPSIRVVALLTEQHDHEGVLTKISLRSKDGEWNGNPPVDVNVVCNQLGGGGHARASGAKVRASLEETKKQLIEALP